MTLTGLIQRALRMRAARAPRKPLPKDPVARRQERARRQQIGRARRAMTLLIRLFRLMR